jgi:hypothetical protein
VEAGALVERGESKNGTAADPTGDSTLMEDDDGRDRSYYKQQQRKQRRKKRLASQAKRRELCKAAESTACGKSSGKSSVNVTVQAGLGPSEPFQIEVEDGLVSEPDSDTENGTTKNAERLEALREATSLVFEDVVADFATVANIKDVFAGSPSPSSSSSSLSRPHPFTSLHSLFSLVRRLEA